jgi:hypothetical protein
MAHRLLDEQVAASRMSRGDYIEYLLREKAGVIEESITAAAQAQAQAPQPAPQQTSFAPPIAEQATEVAYVQPIVHSTSDWNQ